MKDEVEDIIKEDLEDLKLFFDALFTDFAIKLMSMVCEATEKEDKEEREND